MRWSPCEAPRCPRGLRRVSPRDGRDHGRRANPSAGCPCDPAGYRAARPGGGAPGDRGRSDCRRSARCGHLPVRDGSPGGGTVVVRRHSKPASAAARAVAADRALRGVAMHRRAAASRSLDGTGRDRLRQQCHSGHHGALAHCRQRAQCGRAGARRPLPAAGQRVYAGHRGLPPCRGYQQRCAIVGRPPGQCADTGLRPDDRGSVGPYGVFSSGPARYGAAGMG